MPLKSYGVTPNVEAVAFVICLLRDVILAFGGGGAVAGTATATQRGPRPSKSRLGSMPFYERLVVIYFLIRSSIVKIL
jgi:hypothetical protein